MSQGRDARRGELAARLVAQVGIANMAGSLAAIKKLVFDERRITPAELADALETDFAGEKGEQIRQMLVNDAPQVRQR